MQTFLARRIVARAFVVIVHGDGNCFLGVVLPDNVFVELGANFLGLGQFVRADNVGFLFAVALKYVVAKFDAPVANVGTFARDKFMHQHFAFAAKGTLVIFAFFIESQHALTPSAGG